MSGLDIAALAVSGASFAAAVGSAWYTRGQARAAADAVTVARETKEETAKVAGEAKAVAERANEIAEVANRISEESRSVAEHANGLAAKANGIATESVAVATDSRRVAEAANDLAFQANSLAEQANVLAGASNTIADEALQMSRESAMSARESAVAAQATADHERAGLQMQRHERHEQMRPELPPKLSVKFGRGVNGQEYFYVEIEVDRDYRVLADAHMANSSSPAPMDAVLHKGRTAQVFVEHRAPDLREPRVKSIRFRFWPPTDSDGVDPWACGCGAPELADGGRGHWEREVLVYRRPPAIIH